MWLKDISSSDLKKVISIVSHTDGVDEDNIPIEVEQVVKQVRCRVDVPTLNRKMILAQQGHDTNNTLMFIIRYIPDMPLDSKVHKVRYNNSTYMIRNLENVEEMNLYWNIECERTI